MSTNKLFEWLKAVNALPEPFSQYTTIDLWNDKHISEQMLTAHLDRTSDLASRNMVFIQRSSEWMKSYFQIAPSTRVLDFGCGPGLYTTQWARMGADVTGIDASERSIAYATESVREANLPITYICGNYLERSFAKRYDLITIIFCDYCALSPAQRQRLHIKWKELLQPGGRILFDVHSLRYFGSISEARSFDYHYNGFWSPSPHFVFRNVYRYDSEGILLTQFTVVESNRIRAFYNWLQCYSLETLHVELAKAGFKVKESFANVAGDPLTPDANEIAIVAEDST